MSSPIRPSDLPLHDFPADAWVLEQIDAEHTALELADGWELAAREGRVSSGQLIAEDGTPILAENGEPLVAEFALARQRDIAIPVGFVYAQWPGYLGAKELYPFGRWEQQNSSNTSILGICTLWKRVG